MCIDLVSLAEDVYLFRSHSATEHAIGVLTYACLGKMVHYSSDQRLDHLKKMNMPMQLLLRTICPFKYVSIWSDWCQHCLHDICEIFFFNIPPGLSTIFVLECYPWGKHPITKPLAMSYFGGVFLCTMLGCIPLWQDEHVSYPSFSFLDLGGSKITGRPLTEYCSTKSSCNFIL